MTTAQPNSEKDLFSQIREGFAHVAKHADHVTIDMDALGQYARDLPAAQPDNTYDPDHHFVGDNAEDTASYLLAAEAVNFGSAYKGALAEEGLELVNHSIYFTVTMAMKKHFEDNGVMSAPDMAALTPAQCAKIFGFDTAQKTHHELNGLFCGALNHLGQHVQSNYGGKFARFLESGKGSAKTMLATLAELPYYNDVHDYKGRLVPVFKRAQHSLAVIDLEFTRLGQPLFDDRALMTMFADNAVPHVLRMDHVLRYSDALARKIENSELLPSGSAEEVEIRCCAGHAVELIATLKGVSACDVDFNLWHRSLEQPHYRTMPSHKTRSIYY